MKLLQRRKLYHKRTAEATQRISYLQNEVIQKNELEMKVAKLQRAQAAQEAFVQTLKVTAAVLATVWAAARQSDTVASVSHRLLPRWVRRSKSSEGRRTSSPASDRSGRWFSWRSWWSSRDSYPLGPSLAPLVAWMPSPPWCKARRIRR